MLRYFVKHMENLPFILNAVKWPVRNAGCDTVLAGRACRIPHGPWK